MEYFLFILFFSYFVLGKTPNLHGFNNFTNNNYIYLYYFFVILVAILVGLRGNQDEYSRFYEIIPSLENAAFRDLISEKEPIFSFIVSLFQYLSLPPQFIFLFFSSVAVLINGFFFKKMSSFYFLAFLIYLSHSITIKELSGLRLGYASALLLPMIYFIQKKDYIKFSLIYILSSLVQFVGLLSIILLFLNREFKYQLLIAGIFVAILIHYLDFIPYLINFLTAINLIPQIVSDYVNSSYHSYNSSLVFHLKTLQQIVTIVIMLVCFKNFKNTVSPRFKFFNLIFNAYYCGTVLIIMFSSLAIFAYRFSAHFMAVEPIILTYLIWMFKDKKFPYLLLASFSLIIAFINYVLFQRIEGYIFLIQ